MKGWGVWLETIEITSCMIKDQKTFEDLQTNFREDTKKKAEVFKMRILMDLQEDERIHNLAMEKKRTETNRKINDHRR